MPQDNQDAAALFHGARELSDPEERRRYLDQACSGNEELREEVEQLLEADAHADDFFDSPESIEVTRKPKQRPDSEGTGTVVDGRYKLLQLIAEGGFGSVYMAEQSEPVKRRVALKVIKLGMDTKQVIARFEAERQALAMMDHPNIAKVFDAGTTESGRPYFVMELVPGTAITEYCDKNQLNTKERLDLFVQVCDAVQHAHQKGIIHRDIKPSNVLVTLHNGKPLPMVIDFGIAKATGKKLTEKTLFTNFSQMIGTPAYMSPEQAEMTMQDVDTRTDIYSLGVLLYQLLTGTQPFSQKELLSKGYAEMQRIIAEVEPPRLSTRFGSMEPNQQTEMARKHGMAVSALRKASSGDLDWIAMKCLEKDRRRRYETANGLAMDIGRHLKSEPVLARPPSQLYRFQKWVRRNKATAMAATCVMMALVLGLGFALTALAREQAARQRELKETIRADTVGTFINSLLWNAVPSMIQQGNVQGAQDLVNKTDALASSSLTNAPAAELNVRFILRRVLEGEFNDYTAALHQSEEINRLLPAVSDDQLPDPREMLRVSLSNQRLWAAGGQVAKQDQAMKELDGFYAELLKQSPPRQGLAMAIRLAQGEWLFENAQPDQAEEKLAEGYKLLPREEAPDWWQPLGSTWWRHRLPTQYVRVLSDRGKLARAEQVARQSLAIPPGKHRDQQAAYAQLIGQLSGALCAQGRFVEATTVVEEHRQVLVDGGSPEEPLVRMDALRGAVLARSGNAADALPILETVTTNRFSSAWDWLNAALLAAAPGNRGSHQQLCRVALLRFASTAEEDVALAVAWGLLSERTDDTTLAIAHALVERVAHAQDWSVEFIDWLKALLAFREGRYPEALASLDRFRDNPPTRPISIRVSGARGMKAVLAFLRAAFSAELGQADQARQAFTQGRDALKLALGNNPGQDRGENWIMVYTAEIWQSEAERRFNTKGIPLPPPTAR